MKTKNKLVSGEKSESICMLNRRTFMRLSSLGLGTLLLGRCTEPPNPSPINWQPHALNPVFYGLRDYGTSQGAPGRCRVFFPSVDGSPDSATILMGRRLYPLILFAHGQCSEEPDHYKKWSQLAAQLARCGYVVVVPEMPSMTLNPSKADHPALTRMAQMVEWMRSGWPHRNLLRPSPIGVIGHSFGAMLSARFAAASDVSAYVSVAGKWEDWLGGTLPIQQLNKPQFFLWGTEDLHTNIIGPIWDSLVIPKHLALFQRGLHWDYLPQGTSSCENQMGRGPCTLTPVLTADLVSMFFAKYLIPPDTVWLSAEIPDSLIPPPLHLTYEQEFYAGSHLMGFPQLSGNSGCALTLYWNTHGGYGSIRKP